MVDVGDPACGTWEAEAEPALGATVLDLDADPPRNRHGLSTSAVSTGLRRWTYGAASDNFLFSLGFLVSTSTLQTLNNIEKNPVEIE